MMQYCIIYLANDLLPVQCQAIFKTEADLLTRHLIVNKLHWNFNQN